MNLKLLIFILFAVFSACSNEKANIATNDISKEEKAYKEATKLLKNNELSAANEQFKKIKKNFPNSKQAINSSIKIIEIAYKRYDYTTAILETESFITNYPNNKNADYASFIRAMSYFDQIPTIERDQSLAFEAKAAFENLLKEHPRSKYSKEAKKKLFETIENLAAKEVYVAKYYLKTQNYLAARNRLNFTILEYPNSKQIPEALARLTETYISMGLNSQANKSARVLGKNFPKSKWYTYIYELLEKNAK